MLTEAPTLLRDGDAGYDNARSAWNLLADLRPAAIALPRTAAEVADAVRAASDLGLRIAVAGTGHGAAVLAGEDLTDTLLIRTGALDAVRVDPAARVARVGAGATWAAVTAAASPHGLAGLAGSAPSVGVAGYTLGGGIGWLSRRHGLAANAVRAVELVTPDGRLVRADHETERELFWALRGGGGGFGVVTALEVDLVPLKTAYAGMLTFPAERAAEVLAAWSEWTTAAPEDVTTALRIMQLPPLPELPEPLRGRRLVIVDGADLRAEHQAEQHLAPLRTLGPEVDTFATLPAAALGAIHMDPPAPVPASTEHALLDGIGTDALAEAAMEGLDAGVMVVELRQLGGALSRAPHDAGVLSHLRGDYALHVVGIGPGLDGAIDAVLRAAVPWTTGWAFPNFAERRVAGRHAFCGRDRERLRAVRALHDPERRVHTPVPC